MGSGISTSGLFMKKGNRIGDSLILGCGLYIDRDGCEVPATGIGEDLMKG